ncbi:MAG: hypothetical protein AAF358_12740 [Pseudomonadota bacterium]
MRNARLLAISCCLVIPSLSVGQDTATEELVLLQGSLSDAPNAETVMLGAGVNHMMYVGAARGEIALSDADWQALRSETARQRGDMAFRVAKASMAANQSACDLHKAELRSNPPQVAAVAEKLQSAQTTYYEAYVAEFDALLDSLSPEGKAATLEFVKASRVPDQPPAVLDLPSMAASQPAAFAAWVETKLCNEAQNTIALKQMRRPKSFESPSFLDPEDKTSTLGGYGRNQ